MVTTHSESEWLLLRSLRNQGRADSGGWLEHSRLGFNYRLDDIGAAIGLGQLEKLDAILTARSTAAARYARLLADVPGLELPCADDVDPKRSRYLEIGKQTQHNPSPVPTTPTTSARGSCTSSRFPLIPTARR